MITATSTIKSISQVASRSLPRSGTPSPCANQVGLASPVSDSSQSGAPNVRLKFD